MLAAVAVLFMRQRGLRLRKEEKKQKGTKTVWCVKAVAVAKKVIGKGERVAGRWVVSRKVYQGQ